VVGKSQRLHYILFSLVVDEKMIAKRAVKFFFEKTRARRLGRLRSGAKACSGRKRERVP